MNNNMLTYKNYHGSVEVSFEDKCLYGRILFIEDVVTYSGEDFNAIEAAFKETVDDYIETCELVGKSPEKPAKGSFNVRVGEDIHRKINVQCYKEKINLNELVKKALVEYIDKANEQQQQHHHYHHYHVKLEAGFSGEYESEKDLEAPEWQNRISRLN